MLQTISEQERIEKYRASMEEVKELYASDELVLRTDTLIEKFKITQPYKNVSEIIGDAILGFYKMSEVPQLFVQRLGVSMQEAQKMTGELNAFLGPVLAREEEQAQSKKTDLQKLAEAFAEKGKRAQTQTTPATSAQEIKETPQEGEEEAPMEVQEEDFEKVQPLRTMQGDINRVHGYGSYYEELEKGNGEVEHTSEQEHILKR